MRNTETKFATQLNSSLAWDVKCEEIQTASGIILPGFKAIVRNDDGTVLNVAKKTYTPTTNARTIEVVERLAELTGFKPAGFDEFKNGKMVLGYLNAEKSIDLGFEMENYLVVGNSHDGTTSFFIGTSQTMIRCMNQFSTVSRNLRAMHSKNNSVRIDELLAYFEAYKAEREFQIQKMEKYRKVKIDEKIIVALTEKLFQMDSTEEKISTRKTKLVGEFRESIERELKDLGNNAFGLFHGVTHYTTHVQKTTETKVFGNITGEPAKMNNKATAFIDELVFA